MDQFEKKFKAGDRGWGASHSIKEVSAGVAARVLKKSIHKLKCGTAAQIFAVIKAMSCIDGHVFITYVYICKAMLTGTA